MVIGLELVFFPNNPASTVPDEHFKVPTVRPRGRPYEDVPEAPYVRVIWSIKLPARMVSPV
jgi:hypothetical protein